MAGGTIDLVAGDTLPVLDCTYKDVNGNAIDITGFTVRLNVFYKTVLTKVGTIVSGPAGTFYFEWAPGDLVAGEWLAEIELTDASGKKITYQGIVLRVAEQGA